jgi:hypothetical protein
LGLASSQMDDFSVHWQLTAWRAQFSREQHTGDGAPLVQESNEITQQARIVIAVLVT